MSRAALFIRVKQNNGNSSTIQQQKGELIVVYP